MKKISDLQDSRIEAGLQRECCFWPDLFDLHGEGPRSDNLGLPIIYFQLFSISALFTPSYSRRKTKVPPCSLFVSFFFIPSLFIFLKIPFLVFLNPQIMYIARRKKKLHCVDKHVISSTLTACLSYK